LFDWYEFIPDRIFIGLANVLRVFLIFYMYFIISEHLVVRYAGLHPEQVFSNALFFGEFAPLWWTYLIVGTFIPFLMLVIPQTRTVKGILIASLIVVPALWLKRMLIVVPPLTRQLIPNPVMDPATRSSFITPITSIGVYSPSWVEWSLFIGALALGVLMFTLFAKFFPLIELEVADVHAEPEPVEAVPPAAPGAAPAEAAGPPAKCGLCDAEFTSMDECCEHAEKEHGIAKDSCDMACEEVN
jgi:molybdopterin-containing oxidoreductase family membrane subunit